MTKVKVELNRKGVRELLKSQAMKDVCSSYAKKVQAKLGEGYESSVHIGKNRVNASVGTATIQAMQENMNDNTILKALGEIK